MRKRILRIWGASLLIVLLFSPLSLVAPASADTPSWSAESIPSRTGEVLGPTGVDVRDIVVAADGVTIYAVAGDSVLDNIIYSSTDAGVSWTALGVSIKADLVAVAPDDAKVVAIARKNAPAVYITSNGGSTWRSLGTVKDENGMAATEIYDIAISAASTGRRYVAVAGKEAGNTANVWYADISSNPSVWEETNTLPGFTSVNSMKAVAFSPNFLLDEVMVAVGESDNVSINFEIFSLSSQKWNAGAGFADYPVTIVSDDGIIDLTSASISLSPGYLGNDEAKRVAFVGLTINGDTAAKASSGIYRLNNTSNVSLKLGVNIHSVAFDGTNLVAGAYDSNIIYYSTNPLKTEPRISTSSSLKRPGGENKIVVAWAGSDAVAGTSGNESAFAISRDNGKTFNDISLIDTEFSNLTDVAVSPDGNKVYLVTDDGADLSLWRNASSWVRVLSKQNTANYLVRLAPEDDDVIYLAEKDAKTIYYSKDGGETQWLTRSCAVDIQDLAVESTDVAYALSSEGEVSKTTSAGLNWETAKSTKLDADTGHMIVSTSKDNLLVGSTDGYVAYSTDGNSSWHKIPQVLHSGARRIQVIADSDFDNNKIIYAASDRERQKIKKWIIGTSNAWVDIFWNVVPGGVYGLAVDGRVLYALEFDTQNGQSTLWRCLSPTTASGTEPGWNSKSTTTSTDAIDTEVFLNATPQALKVSSGGKLWAIKTNGTNGLYSFEDIMVGLKLRTPEPEFTDPINAVTGIANEIIFSWERWSTATEYKLYIAYDESFNELVTTVIIESDLSSVVVPVGSRKEGDAKVNFMPGTTYYWRVRVTEPLYNLYSEARRFSVGSLEPTPPVVIKKPPPQVIEIPPPPDTTIQLPEIVVPLPPAAPPPKVVISPSPAPTAPTTPTYVWVIISFAAVLVIAVMTVIIKTAWPARFEPVLVEHVEDTAEIVATAKKFFHITKPNSEMTEDDIRKVINWIGEQAQDTVWIDEKPVFGRIGSGVMSIVMKAEFPEFYKQYELSPFHQRK